MFESSVGPCRHRRRTEAHRLLRSQATDIERRPRHQEQRDQVDHIGLRRRDRPAYHASEDGGRTGFVFHAVLLLEMLREWKRKVPGGQGAGGSCRSSDSASSAERLSAEETIRTRLPMVSISRPNTNGAAACAMRAGAPMMPSR